ncbi:MAG: winged helix-turn-helix domain-containing protein [bacterium]
MLAIDPATPRSLVGRSLLGENLTIEIVADASFAIGRAAEDTYDLLVLAGLSVDQQQEIVSHFHGHRRWRLVPVLYVSDPDSGGLAIPGSYRPEIDGLVRGRLDSVVVQKKIVELARDGIGNADMVVAGPYELDPVRGKLRLAELEITLTDREAEILSILLSHPNRTVAASEIIERGWGTAADARYLQILRRHVSNIRRKLERTSAARSVRTVRGAGYRFDVKLAS